jgi:hypothetical protein
MQTVALFLQAFITLWPTIIKLIESFQKTPEEKRQAWLDKVHAAVSHAKQTGGDTSKEEDLING